MSNRLKKHKEQWQSIGIITVMIANNGGIQVTSEGCGDAGEFADAMVNLSKSLLKNADKILPPSRDELATTAQQIALGIGGGK